MMRFLTAIVLLLVSASLSYADVQCRDVSSHNVTDKCNFTKTTDSCAIDEGFINYIQTVFCDFSDVQALGIIVFIVWWLFLFLGLAVTADDFFCPALTVMAKVMRMSDNIAGVTLLAFGNGAPDIFSSIAAVGSIKSGGAGTGLAFGALLGAGVFVTAVVSGAVIIAKPFPCMQRPMLRDITFYIVAVFFTFYVMFKKQITTLEAVGFLLIYVAYVLVVVFGRYFRKKFQQPGDEPVTPTVGINNPNFSVVTKYEQDPDLPTTMSKHLADEAEHIGTGEKHHHHHHHHHHHSVGEHQQQHEMDESLVGEHVQSSRLMDFLDAINPICRDEWNDKGKLGKVYLIVKSPIQLLLTLTCPVVDYDSENDNWNRTLSAIQIILGPTFSIFAIDQYKVTLGGTFPLWALILMLAFISAVLAYYFSAEDEPPRWHPAMAFLGFFVAVVWIYSIANEIVNLLQLFGVFFSISDPILGLTLLAWGNSIGDLIADTALARRGYPRIGISACFGGPLFNLLLGVGIPFTIACIKNGGTFDLDFDFTQIVLTGGLTLSLISTFIITPFVLKFYMKRWYGVYLIVLYVAFLITAILTEANVIKVDVSSWGKV